MDTNSPETLAKCKRIKNRVLAECVIYMAHCSIEENRRLKWAYKALSGCCDREFWLVARHASGRNLLERIEAVRELIVEGE